MRHAVKTESEDAIVKALQDRIRYKCTQTALAKQLGISRAHLNEILALKKKPGRRVIEAMGYDPMPHYAKKEKP